MRLQLFSVKVEFSFPQLSNVNCGSLILFIFKISFPFGMMHIFAGKKTLFLIMKP